jgi:membrane protease YdiL (CAAX protease family)
MILATPQPCREEGRKEEMKEFVRDKIRPVALTLVAPVTGFVLILVLELFTDTEVSKLLSSAVNLVVVALVALVLFPKWLGIPFGRIETRRFLRKAGLYAPDRAWKHLVLGLILAVCTLSGMLVASLLTGRYTVDVGNINLPHLVFSLNPALWEELFYRGVLMILLLRFTRSLKLALAIQVVLFGAYHIKGVDVWAWVDVFSVIVMAVGFTYVAYKTRSLVAGIVFHYFHDAFLYFVQPPDRIYSGAAENATFHGLLWLAVAIGCVITKWAADRGGVRGAEELYSLEEAGQAPEPSSGRVRIDDGLPASAGR